MTLVLVKLCAAVTVILWKCHFITASRTIMAADVNVCENVADHLFIQDIKDCTKYIVCSNGRAREQQCKSGLYFDATRQACITSSQGCLQCPSGRLINIPLTKTCDKYISCYYGQSLLRKCENQQQFNGKTGKCDLAKNVDCVENRCSIYATAKDSLYLPSVVSCANYYICLAGEPKLHTCPDGLYFSTGCNCCDKAENVQCMIDDLKPSKENSTEKTNRFNSNFAQFQNTPTVVGETNNIKCPPIGYFLYQYIDDPAYYYTCVDGKATLYICPNDFHFDNNLKRCVSNEKQDYSAVYVENKCPKFGAHFIPHADNNSTYISCNNGEATVMDCPDEHYFDTSDNVCRANIKVQLKKELTTHATMVNGFSGVVCPKFGTFLFPHVDKNRYYVCIDGSAIGFTCSQGHIFDTKTNTCQLDSIQIESHEDETLIVLDEPVEILCPSQGVMKFAHNQKHKFYLCINGMGTVLACTEGSFFENEMGACRRTFDLKKTANETGPDETVSAEIEHEISAAKCPMSGTFVYPHVEKNLYYVCLEGKSIVLTCPEGQNFDPNRKVCRAKIENENINPQVPIVLLDEIVNIICPTVGVHKFPNIEKNKFYLCLNGMGSIFACPIGSIFKSETGSCHQETDSDMEMKATIPDADETKDINCPTFGTFLYPHNENHKYILCLDGNLFDFSCPEALIFDVKINTCRKAADIVTEETTDAFEELIDHDDRLKMEESKNSNSQNTNSIIISE